MPAKTTEDLWTRLARPFDLGEISEALLGIPAVAARALADIAISTGEEAADLLSSMPKILRGLRTGSNQQFERSVSGIRGPVLWGQTVAARASSLGHPGVFVCSVPGRDYDVIENRMLVESLRTIADSGERVQSAPCVLGTSEAVSSMAKSNAESAKRFIAHCALAHVRSPGHTGRRHWRTLASGRNASCYRPAVAQLDKAANPINLRRLVELSASGTATQHRFLTASIDALEMCGTKVHPLRAESGELILGPFEYLHPRLELSGGHHLGLLRGPDMVVAFDPTGSRTARIDLRQVGARELHRVTTTAELRAVIEHFCADS